MMYLDATPRLIETEVFSAMPGEFRRKGARTDWADANRRGQPTDCFIESRHSTATAISTSSIFRSAASFGSRGTANGRLSLNMTAGPTV
jgi:hypothetical protein